MENDKGPDPKKEILQDYYKLGKIVGSGSNEAGQNISDATKSIIQNDSQKQDAFLKGVQDARSESSENK